MTTTSSSTDGSKKPNRSDPAAPTEPTRPAASPPPSPELLEFLGEFSDERGEWIDPLELDDAELPPGDDEGGGGRD